METGNTTIPGGPEGGADNPSGPPMMDPAAIFRLLSVVDNPNTMPLDILATVCLIAHLRITLKSNRPSLISMPSISLVLVSNFITSIVPLAAAPDAISIPLLVARMLRLALLGYGLYLAVSTGDGLRRDPREDRYGETDGKSWSHADVAWGVLMASIGGTYWENSEGVLSSMLIFTLFVQTLCFAPEIFLLLSYAKEEPRLYRPTRFHGLILPPTPPPKTALTLPLFLFIHLLRATFDFLVSMTRSNPSIPIPLGELVSQIVKLSILFTCLVFASCARLRLWIWRLRSRRRRHGGGADQDASLEFLLDPDERIDGFDEYDDVIREGLDWGIDGTVESLPAYAPPGGKSLMNGADASTDTVLALNAASHHHTSASARPLTSVEEEGFEMDQEIFEEYGEFLPRGREVHRPLE
ncbi:hypothetical protein HDU67_006489 [Dinochytrium kinnereticum]|nr:hypothetical protein HDU67_006489 [Dinochytrium kinnereticum]